MKKQGELTHKEAVKKALEELGGRARLKDIYPRVIPLVKYKPGSDIKATLRRLLQTTPEFFRPVEGMKGWCQHHYGWMRLNWLKRKTVRFVKKRLKCKNF